MISFRISEQEYENLMKLCASQARSVSDLARDTMCRQLGRPAHNGNGHERPPAKSELEEIHGRMRKLEGEVARLTGLLERQS